MKNDKDPIVYREQYWEVRSTTPWNYGLLEFPVDQAEAAFKVVKKEATVAYPWNA